MQRREFGCEFTIEAVRLVRERGVGVAQAARDLDVPETVLHRWMKQAAADPHHAFPVQGQVKPEQIEINRLRTEVARLAGRGRLVRAAPHRADHARKRLAGTAAPTWAAEGRR